MAKATSLRSAEQRASDVANIIGTSRRLKEIAASIRSFESRQTMARKWQPFPISKSDKRIANKLALAVERLEYQLGFKEPDDKETDVERTAVIERVAYGKHAELSQFQTQLKFWRKKFQGFSGQVSKDDPVPFYKAPHNWPLDRSKKTPSRKHSAAAVAAAILKAHGLPLKATPKTTSGPASLWCRVAATIYGDPHAKLYHQCRTFKKVESRK